MTGGFTVVIKYRGLKYHRVASPATPSSEFAILKKDLAHLRVHSPSQKNVQRIDGSFILHWPGVAPSTKVAGLADTLQTRWVKLCSDDPEARKLREVLSIDDVIFSTARTTAGTPPGPPPTSAAQAVMPPAPVIPPPALPPPPPIVARLPPTGPRSDRQVLAPPRPYPRRMTSVKATSGSTADPSTPLGSIEPLQQTDVVSPLQDQARLSAMPGAVDADASLPLPAGEDAPLPTDTQTLTSTSTPPVPVPVLVSVSVPETEFEPTPALALAPAEPDVPMSISPDPDAPRELVKIPTPLPTPASADPISIPNPGPGPSAAPLPARPNPPSHPTLKPPRIRTPTMPAPTPVSPSSSSYPHAPGNGEHTGRLRDRDVSRLMRELWDTRRQKTALQAREQVILDDLERLGARPESTGDSRDELARLEAELRTERARRVGAEQALSDVERECRKPFVVPALYEAFLSISELTR